MNLILLGAPGSGKGTQAELLTEALGIPAISTGNMLREAIASGSDLGKQVKQYMDAGQLVPDELVLSLVAQRVKAEDCANGYILDGVPRTLVQAQVMDAKGVPVDHVVSLEIDDDVITGRMSGRRTCTHCGATYHITANPPKQEGVCDLCGDQLTIRKDDAPETVQSRLKIYHASTEVLKGYYAAQGKLRLINGNQSIEATYEEILRAIGAKV